MNWLGTNRSRGPIGLDVGSRWIKAVQLAGAPGRWRVAAATSIPRTADQPALTLEEVRRITRVLARQGFTGKSVVAAAPGEKLMNGILDVPPKDSGAPVEQITRMELATMHRVDVGSFEMSWWELPAGRGRETSRVMATACAHAVTMELIDLLESDGLEVAALDTESGAVARVCDATSESFQHVAPVLDLGWRAARLILMNQGTIIYERRLSEAAIQPLWQSIQNRLHLEPPVTDYLLGEVGLDRPADSGEELPQLDEAHHLIRDHFDPMTREIQSSLDYAEHQYPAQTNSEKSVMLIGGGAAIPGLAAHLARSMGVDVRAIAPAQRGACPPALQTLCTSPSLTLAAGLAMHEVHGS